MYRNPTPTGATNFIARVVAIAGDHLEIQWRALVHQWQGIRERSCSRRELEVSWQSSDGRVAIEENSGRRYLVAYGDSKDGGRAQDDFDATIPEHHVFVLGDNRDRAKDSRHFGTIHLADIVGYVEYIYWPSESWSRFGVANDRLP